MVDGTVYELNVVGEFVLALSSQSGDTFQVQARLQAYPGSDSASVITQLAFQVGTDRITIGTDRTNPVWVNGAEVALTLGQSFSLSGGQITQTSATSYQITWLTGEQVTVTDYITHLDAAIGLGVGDASGSVTGLLGTNDGSGNAFVLPDGTVLQPPLTTDQLDNEFATSWRVPEAYSLLDYPTGETTSNFTDPGFPTVPLTLADFPQSAVDVAAQAVESAGITDPGAIAAAEFDYLVTGGDPNSITENESLFSGLSTSPAAITESSAPPPTLLIESLSPYVTNSRSVETPVVFGLYLTATTTSDTAADYAVVAPEAGFLAAAAFGGVLPSGQIVIPAGQLSGQITIDVPAGVLGSNASSSLEIQIQAPGGTPIIASTATATVGVPRAGAPPVPQLNEVQSFGDFEELNSSTYNLDLGAISLDEPVPAIQIAITNDASPTADQLGGSLSATLVDAFTVNGTGTISPLSGGNSYQQLSLTLNENSFGLNTETITFQPIDTNPAGYSASLPTITLTAEYTFEAPTSAWSEAWGDVHIITYNGLEYNFQAAGEFVLAHSTAPGDSFDIQLRLEPWYTGAQVSTIRQVAISLGSDRVTFDNTRGDFVELDGVGATIGVGVPLTLAGGTVTELSPVTYQVVWNTGETATITNAGSYMNVTDSFPESETGSISGLQGENE